ncbi:MAG: glycosyltransferase family 39 protein [bacterium]|nr:glycosyltransferase family 39 protein [bacterium]MDZ4296131.1 glycosyltransferase family 39 protein [Patescibacteria group bacterium]
MRLYWLAPPYLNGDAQRDYLASHHIVAYQDYPLLGPWNTFFGIIASPVYFYFLAFFLLIKDDILTLQYVNVALQIMTLATFYIFAKHVFSPRTALIAMTLFSFSHTVLSQTTDFWQPSIMMPFLALSSLLLLWAYTKKSYRLLLSGLFVFTLAGIMHNAAIALFPPFLVAAFMILKTWLADTKQYIGALLAIVIPFTVSHFPVFIYFWGNHGQEGSLLLSMSEELPASFGKFAINLTQTTKFFITLFFRGIAHEPSPLSVGLAVGIIAAGCMYFFNKRRTPFKKLCAGFMSAAILFPILGVSLFTIPLTDRYFMAVLGIFLILTTEYISTLFSENKLSIVFGVILSVLFIVNFSFASAPFTQPVTRENPLAQDIALITRIAGDIAQKEKRPDAHFFQASLYSHSNQFAWFPAELWNGIEKEFNTQFTVYDGFRKSPRDYMPINGGNYMFVVCNTRFAAIDVRTCIGTFSKENPQYILLKEIPTRDSTLYLMKKED